MSGGGSGGGGGRRPRRDTGHAPNHERWMISYADLLTLLLALFIVLYASSAQNKSKIAATASSMLSAFAGSPPSLISRPSSPRGPHHNLPSPKTLPVEAPAAPKTPKVPQNVHHLDRSDKAREQPLQTMPHLAPHLAPMPQPQRLTEKQQQALQPSIKAIAALEKKLHALLLAEIKDKMISIHATPLSITIRLNAKILFDTGEAKLTPGAVNILSPLAQTLAAIPPGYRISIHGYTDDKPIHTTEFPSNWQLSTARALSVVLLFQDQGIAGEMLSAEGFSKYHPVASNDTAAGRQQNRRVSVVISAPKPGQPSNTASASDTAPAAAPETPAAAKDGAATATKAAAAAPAPFRRPAERPAPTTEPETPIHG